VNIHLQLNYKQLDMMNKTTKFLMICCLMAGIFISSLNRAYAQNNTAIPADVLAKATEYAAAVKLDDAAKSKRIETVVANHMNRVRDWHNEHPATTVPSGINPVTGNKLSDLDKQVIADSAMPASVHQELMEGLRKDLSPEQVETILDKYTIGKVAFTMGGYKAIVPDLTAAEEAKILGFLKEAREMAVDYKSMKQISAIFEIYKTKAEQFLNNNGRSWRALYSDYTKKIKAEKAAKKQ
jgi:exopolysaccharide biosynthesis protein